MTWGAIRRRRCRLLWRPWTVGVGCRSWLPSRRPRRGLTCTDRRPDRLLVRVTWFGRVSVTLHGFVVGSAAGLGCGGVVDAVAASSCRHRFITRGGVAITGRGWRRGLIRGCRCRRRRRAASRPVLERPRLTTKHRMPIVSAATSAPRARAPTPTRRWRRRLWERHPARVACLRPTSVADARMPRASACGGCRSMRGPTPARFLGRDHAVVLLEVVLPVRLDPRRDLAHGLPRGTAFCSASSMLHRGIPAVRGRRRRGPSVRSRSTACTCVQAALPIASHSRSTASASAIRGQACPCMIRRDELCLGLRAVHAMPYDQLPQHQPRSNTRSL